MRLKSFNAPDMNTALSLVRQSLGDDAIIISSTRDSSGGGVKVTAAIDDDSPAASGIRILDQNRKEGAIKSIEILLKFHNLPESLREKFLDTARFVEFVDIPQAITKTIEVLFSFQPLNLGEQNLPMFLAGSTGAGKTIASAKIATSAVMEQIPVRVITTDTRRAGGVEQLESFTRILDVKLEVAANYMGLQQLLTPSKLTAATIIDSAGANHYSANEMSELAGIIERTAVDPFFVLPAGLDPLEAAEAGEAFRKCGIRKIIISKMDSSRRLGSVLASAYSGQLAFAGLTSSPNVSKPLESIDPAALTRLLIKNFQESENEKQ